MIRILITLLFCLWFTIINPIIVIAGSSANLQTTINLDSLWGVWYNKVNPDTIRLKAMREIIWDGYLFSQPDSAYYFAQLAYDLSKEKNLKKHIANALKIQGISFEIRGDYHQALKYYYRCLEISEGIADKYGMARAYGSIAGIYQTQSNYPQSIKYHSISLKIMEETGDQKGLCIALNNIGTLYKQQGEVSKAMDYYKKCYKINEELGDNEGMAYTLNNIGLIHLYNGSNTDAMKNFSAALKIYEQFGNKINMASTLNKLGVAYDLIEEPKLAKEHFERSLEINEGLGNKNEIAYALMNIAEIHRDQGNIALSIEFISRALKIAREIGNVAQIRSSSEILYSLYKNNGKYKKSLQMYELTIKMRDSIINEENTRAIVQQELKYEYEKKVATDSIKNAEKAKVRIVQIALQKAKNVKQKQEAYFLYAGLIIAVLFGGFIFNRFTITRRQKKIIQEQQKDITDSIRYAENIQKSLLPTIESLKEVFMDGFVLFQPKDIVSGDFYWMQHINGNVYFAVCDCTGHGVPGAFMSMIGSSLLDEAVIEKGITRPNEIFYEVRKGFINALKQTGETQKDGMDAVLCSWNQNGKLEYSLAYNPFFLIRNGKLIETKADKQPVGFHTGEQKPFTHHEHKLEKGDTVYLFSDGYPDQFGGKKNKKFMMKKFKKLLLSVQDKTMNEQKTILETTMAEWKGNTEQVDDILVMGLRF